MKMCYPVTGLFPDKLLILKENNRVTVSNSKYIKDYIYIYTCRI